MAFEQKDMSGSLFKNTKREKGTHPNATGSVLIDGVDYWVSAWTKNDKNGNPWQSLAFQRKDKKDKPADAVNTTQVKNGFNDFDQDIPF